MLYQEDKSPMYMTLAVIDTIPGILYIYKIVQLQGYLTLPLLRLYYTKKRKNL